MQLDPEEVRTRLEPIFRENFEERGELGAAVSIWQHGQLVADLTGGFRDARREQLWTGDTLVLIWSATKGLGSACVLHALDQRDIDIGRRVSKFWPQFAQSGKEAITIAQLLSHQAGLCALDQPVDLLDYPGVIRALEQQKPLWPPGTAHGYHARTFGFLIDELLRRITGKSIATYWREEFADPLGLEAWIGLPQSENERVATMYAAKIGKTPEPKKFYADLATPGTLSRRAFSSPGGLQAVSAMNKPENRVHPLVSLGGIATAHSLAQFYAALANNGHWRDRQFFSEKALSLMSTTLADGLDRVFQMPTAFSAGFMKRASAEPRELFGRSASAFGHPGAGGSNAFADPENGIGFAYVMNQMALSVLPNEKSLRLITALYDLLAEDR